MRTSKEMQELASRDADLTNQIKQLQEERRKIRAILYWRDYYVKTHGEPKQHRVKPKTPEELREYNRIRQREWRAKHKILGGLSK